MEYSLTKIAKELNLSKTTVSFILSGKARQMRISEELEKKVKEYCEKVNYVPNIHAQRINKRYVKSVGLLIDQSIKQGDDNPFSDPIFSKITGGIVLAAEAVDYRVSIQLYNKQMNESKVYDWLRNHEIDGLIYYGISLPEEWKKTFKDEKRRIVGIGIEPDDYISSVNINNFTCSYKLTEYLISQGRKKFVYMAGVQNSYVAFERQNGFLAALKDNNIPFSNDNCFVADFSEVKAYDIISNTDVNADAVICANDDMAIGVIKALKKKNINVPSEIAVAGADNIEIGKYFCPSLSTFDNKSRELGEAAFEALLKLIKGVKPKKTEIESKIIIRKST